MNFGDVRTFQRVSEKTFRAYQGYSKGHGGGEGLKDLGAMSGSPRRFLV